MTDWLTYSLTDFLPFSRATYLRLFELYNVRFFPAAAVGAALGVWMLWLLYRPTAGRVRLASGVLAVCWLWIAWAFLLRSYAPLNPGAGYAAAAFALQGLLLLAAAIASPRATTTTPFGAAFRVGYGMLVFAVLPMPLLGLMLHRTWTGIELFGTAPDPTVLATLALLLRVRHPLRPLLMVVPAAWSLFSGLTLLAIDDPLWPLLPIAVTVSMALSLRTPPEIGGRNRTDG
jgi:Family of unknown function (DUF6064)